MKNITEEQVDDFFDELVKDNTLLYLTRKIKKGDAEAMYSLGQMYYFSDDVKAIELFKKAAEKGHVESMHHLATMYKNGKGTKQNLDTSIKWYKKAAEKGYLGSQFKLGEIYYYEINDYKKAYKWFYGYAKQGNAMSQYYIAKMYYDGHGIKQDFDKAIYWFTKAAESGNAHATKELRDMDIKWQQKNK